MMWYNKKEHIGHNKYGAQTQSTISNVNVPILRIGIGSNQIEQQGQALSVHVRTLRVQFQHIHHGAHTTRVEEHCFARWVVQSQVLQTTCKK